jgi:hypothetical protein
MEGGKEITGDKGEGKEGGQCRKEGWGATKMQGTG